MRFPLAEAEGARRDLDAPGLQAAFDDALRYAQERESFGKPIWQHQSIGNYLADMATKLTAARQLVLFAAERVDSGERADLEADVRASRRRILDSPFIPQKGSVRGFVFDVATGRLAEVQ